MILENNIILDGEYRCEIYGSGSSLVHTYERRANKLPSARLETITLQRREECALNPP